MSTPLDLRAAIVAKFDAELPDAVRVAAHPGRFDLAELKRYVTGAPAVRVAVLEVSPEQEGSGLELVCRCAAYTITRAGRDYAADEHSLVLAALMLPIADGEDWDLADASAPRNLAWQNLYASDQGRTAVHLAAMTWDQRIGLGVIDETTLDAFAKFFADWDLGPEPDGQIEAEDDLQVPQ